MASLMQVGPGPAKRAKRLVAGVVFGVLGRGTVACARLDERVRTEVMTWPDGTVITLSISPGSPRTTIRWEGGRLEALGSKTNAESTLLVSFKSVEDAFPALIGMKSVLQPFAEHRATVKGDLALAMSLVRCLHIVEGYLFPDIMNRRILPLPAKREVGHLRAYVALLGTSADLGVPSAASAPSAASVVASSGTSEASGTKGDTA